MSKFTVDVNGSRCKGCMMCISVCPKNILETNQQEINEYGYHPTGISDQELCVGCAGCALICPDLAIEIKG